MAFDAHQKPITLCSSPISFLLTFYVKIYDFLAVMIRGVQTSRPDEVEIRWFGRVMGETLVRRKHSSLATPDHKHEGDYSGEEQRV
jgi:hypothetical protein